MTFDRDALPITGACLCGAICYQISQRTIRVSRCHCVSCRKATGATGVAWLLIEPSNLLFTKGQPRT